MTGANATTVLVRRVKQGVAEWFRLQIKEKAWRGLREHSLAGWNIGTPPYGYLADRVPHPVAYKAAQGRTKTRLILDPGRAPVVAAIFAWRTQDKLGGYAITQRLNARPDLYPSPRSGRWTEATVYAILRNPKYTGHMVFGRQRTTPVGRCVAVPEDQWLWSPEPAHPAIITRATWDAAQAIGAEHSTSRDDPGMNTHPATRRTYVLRSRVRCRSCQRRMSGITRTSARYSADGPDYSSTYYTCHHDPANPQAFDLQALHNNNLHQVTIHATITDTTPRALAAIISDTGDGPQASPAGPARPGFSDLVQGPIARLSYRDHEIGSDSSGASSAGSR
jgi:Recombinase